MNVLIYVVYEPGTVSTEFDLMVPALSKCSYHTTVYYTRRDVRGIPGMRMRDLLVESSAQALRNQIASLIQLPQ